MFNFSENKWLIFTSTFMAKKEMIWYTINDKFKGKFEKFISLFK